MKRKIFTLLLCALFSSALWAQPYAVVVKKASAAPEIDGIVDDVWAEADVINFELPFQTEMPTLGSPGETTWQALWDDNGIYVLLIVTDDVFFPHYAVDPPGNNWEFDKPEIYFDCNAVLADGIGAGGNQGHYQVAPGFTDGSNDGTAITENLYTYAFLVTEPNYIGEYFVPWAKLVDKNSLGFKKTAPMGFDVTIIDRDDAAGTRQRLNWSNDGLTGTVAGESWNSMDGCGTITFEGATDAPMAEELTISVPDDATTIATEAGTLQFTAAILPEEAVQAVVWTVENGTGRATISSTGLLTAVLDGTVTVVATTADGTEIEDYKVITISNQFVSISDIDAIKNGTMSSLNGTSASFWEGWTDASPAHTVEEGVSVHKPVAASGNVWNYQFIQKNLTALPNADYIFSFKAWSDVERSINADFEDGSNGYNRYGASTDAEAIGNGQTGRSDWIVNTTTVPTVYTLHVNFDEIKANTIQQVAFFLGKCANASTVYIDDVSLYQAADLDLLGVVLTDFAISSAADATTITTDMGTLQMTASGFLPENAGLKEVNWTVVNGTGKAVVDKDGLVTAVADGKVTVTATAKDGSGLTETMEITISNQVKETLSVNTAGAGFVSGDRVFVTGDFCGWSEPGTGGSVECFDTDGDGIFTASVDLYGAVKFKFFKNTTWANGEPVASDRAHTFVGGENLSFDWGVLPVGIRNSFTGKVQMYPNPVGDVLNISSTTSIKSVVISSMVGQIVHRSDFTSRTDAAINTSSLAKGMYIVTFISTDGNKVSRKLMKR
jgi:uncharacterized protein YjdB